MRFVAWETTLTAHHEAGVVVVVLVGGDSDVCWPESTVSRGSAHHLSDILKRKMNVE